MQRCKPNNLQFEAQSQVGKSQVYHDEIPIADMLAPGFWRNVVTGKPSDRLRPSDRLTLMRVEYRNADRADVAEVIEVLNVTIASVSKDGWITFLGIKPKARAIDPPLPETPSKELHIKSLGFGHYAVLDDGGNQLAKIMKDKGGKERAQAIADGKEPMPDLKAA